MVTTEVQETKSLSQTHFEGIDIIGEGAEGRVLKAKVPELGDEFAIKIYDSKVSRPS